MTITTRKQHLLDYIEARELATQRDWVIPKESPFEVWTTPQDNLIGTFSPRDDYSFGKSSCWNNINFVVSAANHSAQIARDLLVCLETLESISKNSCCDRCQEAKLIAVSALNKIGGEK